MIDRKARNEVIAALEAYLDDEITAFAFDDLLHEVESDDQTVNEVILAARFHYDDCRDHKVHLSKPEWDYFQRLLLVLRSDAELYPTTTRRWAWDHAVAWTALVVFIGIAFVVGWGWQLLAWSIPFGLVSIGISIYRRRQAKVVSPREVASTPFNSYTEIRQLRRRLPEFTKRRYRPEIAQRAIRSEVEMTVYSTLSYVYWIAFGPLILLFQGFPSTANPTARLAIP